jgi:deoxycytidine triphosphate deaminase
MATGMLSDKDINDQLKQANPDLVIEHVSEECITPVGYDVRAGDTVFSYDSKEVKSLKQGEATIIPGDTVFISSLESFKLSERIGGLTVARLGPQLDGLQLAALSVDPTWRGELLIILTNHGRKPVKIKYGDRLMTLCLFWMTTPSSKCIDRERWDNENIMRKFKDIEIAAARPETVKMLFDFGFPAILGAMCVMLRIKGKLETNVDTSMLWVSTIALYFSLLRRLLFRAMKFHE